MGYEPLLARTGRVHVCAHRGHSIATPENTLPALAAAARLRATVAEIDVVLSREGVPVLMHDEILDRTTDGKGRVADYDLEALGRLDAGSWLDPSFAGTRVPTLAEALDHARELGLGLLVEIKERRRVEAMIEALADVLALRRAVEEVLVISFDHPSLLCARARIPGLRTELITHARHVDIAGLAQKAEASSVAIEWDMFAPEDAAALHAAGIAVRVTIPRPARLAFRRGYGLDDEPALGRALADGLIDVLAGDDTAYLTALLARHRPS